MKNAILQIVSNQFTQVTNFQSEHVKKLHSNKDENVHRHDVRGKKIENRHRKGRNMKTFK